MACAVLEPVQGEGGFIPMTPEFPRRLQELLDSHGILYVDDEVQSGCGRTGPVWAIEHYGVEPDLLVERQVARRRAPARGGHRSRRGDGRRAAPGGLGGTFGGNPVSCAAASPSSTPSRAPATAPRRSERASRERLEAMAPARLGGARPRPDARARARRSRSADATAPRHAAAREQGLILLSCGIYGNVIRILVPFAISDEELERGLDILEACVAR